MTDSKTWCHDCFCWHDTGVLCPEMRMKLDRASATIETVAERALASATQVGGDHYAKLAIQPMEYSMKNGLDPLQHTVIKYVTRFRDKNGVEDLRKAIHTIELLIEYEERSAANG